MKTSVTHVLLLAVVGVSLVWARKTTSMPKNNVMRINPLTFCKNESARDECLSMGGLENDDSFVMVLRFRKFSSCDVWHNLRLCLENEARCPERIVLAEKKEFEKTHRTRCKASSIVASAIGYSLLVYGILR